MTDDAYAELRQGNSTMSDKDSLVVPCILIMIESCECALPGGVDEQKNPNNLVIPYIVYKENLRQLANS